MVIGPAEFAKRLKEALEGLSGTYDYVTGPGRSGAVAAVYTSYMLGIPFVPYKHFAPGRVLIVDTAEQSGRTLRKASRYYGDADTLAVYKEPPRVHFWYEKPLEGIV